MRVLLTGATGFVGKHTLRKLLETGTEVLCTRRKSSQVEAEYGQGAQWIYTDSPHWKDEVRHFKPQVIVHCAWSGVDAANRGNWAAQVENVFLQQELLDLGAKCGTERYLSIGSQAEYGTFDGCVDETYPANPNTAYGATKLACMDIARSFCELNAMRWYWFRLFPCFGPGESDKWLIPSTIKNMMKGGEMDFTPGEQKYAYLYIGQVAAVIAAATTAEAPNGIYNISSDQVVSIKELLTKIRDEVNKEFTLNFGALPYRVGQTMLMQGNIDKTRRFIYPIDGSGFDDQMRNTIASFVQKYR